MGVSTCLAGGNRAGALLLNNLPGSSQPSIGLNGEDRYRPTDVVRNKQPFAARINAEMTRRQSF